MLLVVCPDGERRRIRLGRVTARQAEDIQRHVEHLATCRKTGSPMLPTTAEWLGAASDTLRDRLVLWGLAEARAPKPEPEPVPEPKPVLTLGAFLADHLASRVDIKPSTRIAIGQAVRHLTEYFVADRPIDTITAGDADAWRAHLKGTLRLADNTVRKLSGAAKGFFRAAVRKELLTKNPFADLKSTVRGNPAREHFISRAVAEKVIEACPDAQWRLIFALCRYGGLRCPSEILGLTLGDIHWAEGRFTVHSPKTEHHPGKESREVPLYPELLPYLREVEEGAAPGTVYCITRYRESNANLRTQLCRILRKAGLTPWPKLFQNLRSTRQTELAQTRPIHVVCAYMGNSRAVALEHYLQVTEDDYRQDAAQNAAQYQAVSSLPERESGTADVQQKPVLPHDTEPYTNLHIKQVVHAEPEPVEYPGRRGAFRLLRVRPGGAASARDSLAGLPPNVTMCPRAVEQPWGPKGPRV